MSSHIAPSPLIYTPGAAPQTGSAERLPAAPGAVQRFEMLMYAPPAAGNGAYLATSSALDTGGLRHYVEALSQRWQAGQSAIERMAGAGKFTSKELIKTQVQMINCALDVEVSSKCASMFENGVQTLIQRG